MQLPTVLTITHSPTESVARLGGWLSGAGLLLDVRSPYEGGPLPSLRGFAGLLVMGGAMGAYDDGAGHAHAIQRLEHGWAVAADPRAESAVAGT